MRKVAGLFSIAFAAGLIFLFSGTVVLAQNAGNASGDFLKLNIDPESIALGGSILSFNSSPAAMITNPAALADNFQPKLSFASTVFDGDIKYNFAGIAVPLKFGTIGAGASYLDYGAIQGYYAGFVTYDIPQSGETAITFNYAIPLRTEVPVLREYGSLGMNIKFVHSNLAGYTSDVTAVDIGGTCKMPFIAEGVSSALVLRNIGNSPNYDVISGNLPTETNLAVRYDLPMSNDFFAVLDAGSDPDNNYYSAGLGISPVYPLTVKCGWKEGGESAATGFCMGFGVNFNNFSLRYALSPMKDISAVQTIALEITFESFTNTTAAYDHYLSMYFELARDKYNNKDYIGARQIFEDILSVYPGHLPSKEYLLRINSALDEMEHHRQVQVDRWLRKADVDMERNDIIEARKYYSLVLNIDSVNTEALAGMNKIKDLTGELTKPESEQLDKAKITKLWDEAVGLYDKSDYVASREKFQEVLRLDPNNREQQNTSTTYSNNLTG